MQQLIFRGLTMVAISATAFGQKIFDATHAGSWYPKDGHELRVLLSSASRHAHDHFSMQTDRSKIRLLVVPHAGYAYSANIAAAAYNLVSNKDIDQVMILGPSHFESFSGIAVPTFQQYRTPLGVTDLNTAALKRLSNDPLILRDTAKFVREHSIEMQLPFIQYTLPNAKIIPIMVGTMTESELIRIAQALKPLITKKTLLVVSTDLTHYGPSYNYIPFKDHPLLRIKQLDSSLLDPVQHQHRKEYEAIIAATRSTMCGYNPMRIALELLDKGVFGPNMMRLVAYGTSADVRSNDENIVSYGSLIATNETDNVQLNQLEQTQLLAYARATLQQFFHPTLDPTLIQPLKTLLLEKPQGVFPTLWTISKDGSKKLRGCIGQIYAGKPLYEELAAKVIDAAINDTRFSPVQEKELPTLRIEISVLREPKPIRSYKEIVLGRDGIILTQANKSALFLPSVPKEFGFTRQQTLEELSLKAGLSKDAWKNPSTKFHIFQAQDFHE